MSSGITYPMDSIGTGWRAEDAVARLEAVGLAPRRRQNRFYFDDPDGLEVQVTAG